MADTGYLFPSSATSDNAVGVNAWVAPTNVFADDGSISSNQTHASVSGGNVDDIVRLVVAGSITGTDLSNGQNFSSAGNRTFGGATELWGLTPTAAQVNATNFGVALSVRNTLGGVLTPSQYLVTTNFGVSIPTDATVNGIEVLYDVATPATGQCRIDSVQLKVYYTESGSVRRIIIT